MKPRFSIDQLRPLNLPHQYQPDTVDAETLHRHAKGSHTRMFNLTYTLGFLRGAIWWDRKIRRDATNIPADHPEKFLISHDQM